MEVEITPILSHIRVYTDGDSYQNRDEYTAIVTAQFIGNGVVYLSGAKGKLTRKLIFAVRDKLKLMGIHTAYMERDGEQQVKIL